MTACPAWSYALFAGRTRRRLELVLSPPAMGVVSLPVKMQSVVRALTADTLSFDENTLSAVVRGGKESRSTATVTSAVRRPATIPTPVSGQHGVAAMIRRLIRNDAVRTLI